ncbi:MAG: HAMP domain-containing protein, partial [Thermoanaerobaculia bacterium]|nr:HAMP domain-containing protein [Thermoanaerobaculia bacterium]
MTAPDGRDYVVYFPEGRGPVDRTFWRWILDWPWLVAVLLAVAGLLTAGGLAAAWTRPIRALRRGFDALAEGRLDARVESRLARRRDELGDLGRHFDAMAARLSQSTVAQRQLLHDVSHELRSPLARLSVAVELARRRPERAGEALDRIEKESSRLDRLIGEVLTLARLEASGTDALDDYVDLVALLQVIAEDARFEAGAAGVGIDLEAGPSAELVLRGNGELLHRAIENVVRNALKHAGASDRIELEVAEERAAGRVRIRVRDHGEGVSEAGLEAMFEPFTRASGSPGFGLGLAIARRAVEVHRGAIRARNHPDGGLEVEIVLPNPPC